MKEALRDWMRRLREDWGFDPRHPQGETSGEWLEVYLPREGGERLVIGRLSRDGDEYVFRYEPAYAKRRDAVPISAFPDLQETYRARMLWPFFAVRVPPLEREDVRLLVKAKQIPETDVLRLLGELSVKAVSSPYQFALHAP